MTKTLWRLHLSTEAEKDFARILRYTKDNFGPKQAATYRVTLLEALSALLKGPNLLGSSARNDILPNLRTLHVARLGRRGRHFIIYRAEQEDVIEVVRILHDAMDLARHVPPDSD